jgi:anti-sigma B factor antagonist
MALFEVYSEEKNHFGIIYLKGYINEKAGEKIRQLFDQLLDEKKNHIILNMQETTLINSMGIAYLISILNKLMEIGGRLFIVTQNDIIIKTLKIMGIEKFCTITDTMSDLLSDSGK